MCWSCFRLFFFGGCFSRFEIDHIFFRYSATFPSAWHLVDVNFLHFGKVSHSWSRQSFSLSLITWTCFCNFIMLWCLHWRLSCRCFVIRSCCLFLSLSISVDLENRMAYRSNVVVIKLDCWDLASGGWRDLCNELICEYFAQILVLKMNSELLTSSTLSPTFTNHCLIVASFVPSPRSGNFTFTLAK